MRELYDPVPDPDDHYAHDPDIQAYKEGEHDALNDEVDEERMEEDPHYTAGASGAD